VLREFCVCYTKYCSRVPAREIAVGVLDFMPFWWESWLGPVKSGCTDETKSRAQFKKLLANTVE